VVSGSNPPADPIVYFGAGAIALGLAVVVRKRPPAPPKEGDSKVSQLLSRSQKAWIAFAAGLLIDLVPGAWYIVALKDIAQSGYSDSEIVAVVVAFCIIQYALIELPLLGFVFAPERAADLSRRFSTWLSENSRTVAVAILVIAGCYMIIRGIATVV